MRVGERGYQRRQTATDAQQEVKRGVGKKLRTPGRVKRNLIPPQGRQPGRQRAEAAPGLTSRWPRPPADPAHRLTPVPYYRGVRRAPGSAQPLSSRPGAGRGARGGPGWGWGAGQGGGGVVVVLRVTTVNNEGGCGAAAGSAAPGGGGAGTAPVGPQGRRGEMGTRRRE